MIPLFLGLTAVNLLLLSGVFLLGLSVTDAAGEATSAYSYHIVFAVAAGLFVAFVHVTVYTYFMATTKWLGAATDKADLDPQRFVAPSLKRKSRAFAVVMTAVGVTMLTMFAGAAADTMAWMPAEVHLVMAMATLLVNGLCAAAEYRFIRQQGALMDEALAIVNATPRVPGVEHA